jgi:hypothetical protein
MTSGQDLIANHWKAAECTFYNAGTSIAAQTAWRSLLTGQYWATIGIASVGWAFQYAAQLAGCNYNPGEPSLPSGCPDDVVGCSRTENGYGQVYDVDSGKPLPGDFNRNIIEIKSKDTSTGGNIWWCKTLPGQGVNGTDDVWIGDDPPNAERVELVLSEGDCAQQCGGDDPGTPGPIGQGYEVEDEGCNWTFTPYDSFIDQNGNVQVYWVIEADNDACGGPFSYWSGPDGPQPVNPYPPTPDPPDPPDPDPPKPPNPIPPRPPCPPDTCTKHPALGGTQYKLTGICEDVEENQPQPEFEYKTDGGAYYSELASRIDQLALMLQKHLELRTPTCANKRPELKGDWVTTRWKSDEVMEHSGTRLRKLFRYRSQSTRTLPELSEYWRAFTWRAGNVCVFHKGAWWGTPQVWAETEEEGRRVIRFAAAEAGIDPDQVGQWGTSGSRSPRYGVSGTMRIQMHQGFPWVASRDGANWPNELARMKPSQE